MTIDKITFAVGKMEEMVAFYTGMFDMKFKSFDAYESTLYTGKLGDMELLFCPKEVARVDAKINTIQPRFVVQDVENAFKTGLEKGGTAITEPQLFEGAKIASLRDPDGNSVELIQKSKEFC